MTDPTGLVVRELRDAAAAWPAPFTDYPVDPGFLAGEHVPLDGATPQVIVVRRQPSIRARRIPVQAATILIDIYHPEPESAAQLAGLVSDAFHNVGPRTHTRSGQKEAIYASADVGQSGTLTEPETRFTLERVTLQVTAGTQVLA